MGFGVRGAPEGSTWRLIFGDTFAACSKLSSSFVNVKVPLNRKQQAIWTKSLLLSVQNVGLHFVAFLISLTIPDSKTD